MYFRVIDSHPLSATSPREPRRGQRRDGWCRNSSPSVRVTGASPGARDEHGCGAADEPDPLVTKTGPGGLDGKRRDANRARSKKDPGSRLVGPAVSFRPGPRVGRQPLGLDARDSRSQGPPSGVARAPDPRSPPRLWRSLSRAL